MAEISYRRHRFPPVIIQHAVWLYLRFTLSYRDVEELLAERGLDLRQGSAVGVLSGIRPASGFNRYTATATTTLASLRVGYISRATPRTTSETNPCALKSIYGCSKASHPEIANPSS